MRSRGIAEDNFQTMASERVCLQAKKRQTRFYVIKNKTALTILTRLVFVVLMLFSAGVITTSIWLMMECRQSFTTVRPMLPRNIQFCTNMGMPALFACCTVLFAIFGLGCTGRRLTGYALIIISSVEILQSVTALTFYSCNTMSRQEIARSVNSSLFPCYTPDKSLVPFVYGKLAGNNAIVSYASPLKANLHLTKKKSAFEDLPSTTVAKNNTASQSEQNKNILHSQPHSSSRNSRHKRREQSQRGEAKVSRDEIHSEKIARSFEQNIEGENLKVLTKNAALVAQQRVECTAESRYFWNLSQRLKKTELSNCVSVCKAYQTVCPVTNNDIQYTTKVPPLDTIQFAAVRASGTHSLQEPWSKDGGAAMLVPSVGPGQGKTVTRFDRKVEECGYRVYQYVSDLCYYDNKIILPISLCAPLLCIAMSACFIYLAFCDRRLKEDSQTNISIQVPESNDIKTSTPSLSDCCLRLKNALSTQMCRCHVKRNPVWGGLVCCSYCTSLDGQLDPECSNSTHELLHLRAVAGSGALSPAVSQYTLNASVSDDCSPILPRWS
ncbi:hypothetical protein BsWGS_03522 [Bradybaena similaris]